MITLLKNHDRVASASLAQLVNVIAPIMTKPGGAAWRQSTLFPFSVTARLARGEILRPTINVGTYETSVYGRAPLVDAVAKVDVEAGSSAVFLVNRSQTESIDVSIDIIDLGATTITEAHTLHDEDVYAKNTFEDQNRVGLTPLDGVSVDNGTLTVTLPPVSWSAIALTQDAVTTTS